MGFPSTDRTSVRKNGVTSIPRFGETVRLRLQAEPLIPRYVGLVCHLLLRSAGSRMRPRLPFTCRAKLSWQTRS